jgi:YHS domain-containing protein
MGQERDPVCGMTVDAASPYSATHDGHTYHFCSENCRDRFEAQPSHYAAADRHTGQHGETERFDPPHTVTGGLAAPKFGSAGSGGAEYERIRE